MITSIKLYPINIPVGSVLNSDGYLLFNNPMDEDDHHEWPVGCRFHVTHPLYKLIVVERIGTMVIHRHYLTDEELRKTGTYMPIYLKIYGSNDTQMLAMRAGITYAWRRYAKGYNDPVFVNHRVASTILNTEMGVGQYDLIDAWAAYRNTVCPYSSDVDNNWQFMSEPSYDPYSPNIWRHNECIGYDSHEVITETYDFMTNIEEWLTCPLQNDSFRGRHAPYGVTCDRLDYILPNEYSPIAMDRISRRDIESPTVNIKHIINGGYRSKYEYIPLMTYEPLQITVFEYDSLILDLCTQLLQCHFIDLSCTYTLSTGQLDIHHSTSVYQSNGIPGSLGPSHHLLTMLDISVSAWGYQEVILVIDKNYTDTVRIDMTVCGTDGSVASDTYVIDLSLTPVINHTLTM